MNDKLKDSMIELLLGGIKEKIDSVRKDKKWRELFVNTGRFLVTNTDTLDSFERDLYLVFSKDNLKVMANKLRDKSGYEFSELLHEELYGLMVYYDISPMEAETYIHHFMKVIISYLEENDADKILQMFLGNWKKEQEKHFLMLGTKLDLIITQIEELKKEKIESFSIEDIDVQIRRESKYKGMGLHFFELDDEQFEAEFKSAMDDENEIYIVGKSREETTYRIINELRQRNSDRITLIIKSEKEWEKLQKVNLVGKILIPFFSAEQIVAIPNNINIFVYGEDEPCYVRERLELRKRTRRNIVNSLERIGIDSRDAYNMVENTHGLYVPLKKKLFKGAIHMKPDWVDDHSDVIMAALLCGKWTDSTGDALIFEELAGKKYPECLKELQPYLHRENPYIVVHKSHSGSSMQLASVEDAWEELDTYITEELWKKIINLFYEVLIESEPIFEYPFDKHFEASIYAEKPIWSQTLKRGMIRTLIMRAQYRGHEEFQNQIDKIVARVLDTITNTERWGYIAQYLPDLCEASPGSVLAKLENELEDPKGLLELFSVDGGDIFLGRHYYTNILWAVEQLLLQKKYVVRALDWLWKVDSYNIKYSISNSPKGILDVVYCAWLNTTVLSVEKKIEFAKAAVKKYANAWDIIVSKLPNGTHSVCAPLNNPKYRQVDEPDILYINEVRKTYIEYLRLCVETAGTNDERWNKIIQCIDTYGETIKNEVFEKLILNCVEMSDDQKIKIKNAIRYKIYRNRYFCDAEWSASEDVLEVYEKVLEQIVVSDKVYDFIYIFSPKYEFPLLHPLPFSREEKNNSRHENYRLMENEIETQIKLFKEKNYSLEKLITLGVKVNQSTLGEILARFYCDGKFDEKVFCILLDKERKGKCAYDYVRYLYTKGVMQLDEAIRIVKGMFNHKNLLVDILSLEIIENKEKMSIANEGEEIKKLYWNRNIRFQIADDAGVEVILWALDECRKYGTLNTYLELLFDTKDKISEQELYNRMMSIYDLKTGISNSMTSFYLEEILKELQEAFMEETEKCSELAKLEWMCRNVLEWDKMKCLQKMMKADPFIYAQLVRILYKTDDYESVDETKRELANKIYEGFDKAKFCPTERDGKVSYEELKIWVEKFKELLAIQKQERLFGSLVGRLLAYSPKGKDGYSPCEAVRKIIEEYFCESLKMSYLIEEENKRGSFIVDAGKSELGLYHKYLKNAEGLQEQYPRTAEIYFSLSDIWSCVKI